MPTAAHRSSDRQADDDERQSPGADGHENGNGHERPLRRGEWRTLALLGVPTFGLALGITTVTTYLPKVAADFAASTIVIGVMIGGEGLMALFLPLLAGSWSDQLRTRIGGRLPFVIGAAPVIAVALAVLGFVGSILAAAVVLAVFFAAYYTAYEPYRALYPDLVDDEIAGRAQSTQALFRGAATAVALVGGGLLFAIGPPVPFVVAAVILLAAIGAFVYGTLRGGPPEQDEVEGGGVRDRARDLREVIREQPKLKVFFAANALWEMSLSALKTFVVLYVTVGLGYSVSAAALIIGGTALIVLIASPVSGKLGDRFSRGTVLRVALWLYGLGLLVPFVTQTTWLLIAVLPLVAFGGGVIMTLPYALLMPMMPHDEHGALTGFYSLSRGVGTGLGPLLAGVAIQLLRGPLGSTNGYAAMWLVCGLAILASIPLVRMMRDKLT
jgi:MFS family permease